MTHQEAYDRAREAHKEAWQMALDHNQSAEVRREWEKRRDAYENEMHRLAWRLPGFTGLDPAFMMADSFVD